MRRFIPTAKAGGFHAAFSVKSLLENESTPKNSYWMGGYKDNSNKWIWTNGENWNYSNWGYDQPDGDGKALMMYCNSANGWSLGSWNDIPDDGNGIWGDSWFFSTDKFGLICEWDSGGNLDSILEEKFSMTGIEMPKYGVIEDDKLIFVYTPDEDQK